MNTIESQNFNPKLKEACEFNSLIPVIDLNDFYNPIRKEKFIDDLGNAFHEHGFIAVKNIDMDFSILEKAYTAVKDFFSQDLPYKTSIQSRTNNGERGYVTIETPKRLPANQFDFKEILHIGRELSEEQQTRLEHPKNLWPENSTLKKGVMPLYDLLEKKMQSIAQAAAIYLKEPLNLFTDMTYEGEHLLRCLHYLKSTNQNVNWAAEHTDMNFLTLIPGGSTEGLQVQLKDGRWIDVLVPDDSVVVNVGDSFENLTNGFYRSGVHRVISTPNAETERWSIVFNSHARHDLEMGPLPSTIKLSGGKQKFPNAKGWELLYAQIAAVGRATHPMLKQLAECGVMEEKIKYGQASEKVMQILAEHNLASKTVLNELKSRQLH